MGVFRRWSQQRNFRADQVGLACAFITGMAAARLLAGSSGGWGDPIGAIVGALIGYAIGVALGVYAASRRFGNRRPMSWPAA